MGKSRQKYKEKRPRYTLGFDKAAKPELGLDLDEIDREHAIEDEFEKEKAFQEREQFKKWDKQAAEKTRKAKVMQRQRQHRRAYDEGMKTMEEQFGKPDEKQQLLDMEQMHRKVTSEPRFRRQMLRDANKRARAAKHKDMMERKRDEYKL